MIRIQKKVIKLQLPLFFLLSYLLSWWPLALVRGLLAQGVAISALIVVLFTSGKEDLRDFWNRLMNFRAGWLYLAAPTIIIGFILFNVISNLLAGGRFVGFPQVPLIGIAIELLIFGGLWEEPGWSGYALPNLQKRYAKSKYGILIATIILGVFRGIWHLPLLFVGAIPWYDAIWFTPFVFQPFITWLYNKSGGSVPVVMFFHYLSNLLFAFIPSLTGADKPLYTIIYMTLGGLATLILVWKTQFKLGWQDASSSGVEN